VRQPILSPDRFAEWFNLVVPGAYRKVTVQDIRDMTECGFIGKYQYYGRADLETVRAILLYEQMREERLAQSKKRPTCKMCGKPFSKCHDKRGRPREYCFDCEPLRGRERYRKWYGKEDNLRRTAIC